MASTWSQLLLSRSRSTFTPTNYFIFTDLTQSRSGEKPRPTSFTLLHYRTNISVESPFPLTTKLLTPPRLLCFAKSTEEKQSTASETVAPNSDDAQRQTTASSGDSLSLGIREPVYDVRCYHLITSEFFLLLS